MRLSLGSLKNQLLRSKKSIFLIVVVAALTLILSALLSVWLASYHNVNLPSIGRIKAIGIEAYWDKDFRNKTTAIDWGTVYVGSRINVTLYIRSVSNEEISLAMKPDNWVFELGNGTHSAPTNNTHYLNLTWNCEGKQLKPGMNASATFALAADTSSEFLEFIVQNEVMSFSFDIRIQPKELTWDGVATAFYVPNRKRFV